MEAEAAAMETTYPTLVPLFDALRGERVLVRPYKESDAQALQEAVAESRDHIRPWLPFADLHMTVEESRDWINRQSANFILRTSIGGGVWEHKSGRFLGGLGIHPRDWNIRYFEIGYWLRKSAGGRGYMTEAVRLATDYLLSSLEAQRVEIRCDERNERSAAVARRMGFVLEARLRNDTRAEDGSVRTTLVFSRIPGDP